MNRYARKSLPDTIRTCLRVAAFVLLPSTVAWGAPPAPLPLPGAGEPKSYVYQYFVVGLSFAMGLALLYRPRQRKQEVDRIAAED